MDTLSYKNEKYVIAGFGNPLLDICVTIHDNSLLYEFNLLPDGQKEVNEVELKAILNSISRNGNQLTYCAGGAAQNTLRTIQHLVKTPSYTVFFGSCGHDEQSEILQNQVRLANVEIRYSIKEKHPTGTSISLINGQNRSLVAHLGAANVYTLEDLLKQDNTKILEYVSFVYIEGFFISHSFDVALEVIKICRQHGSIVAFNLSGVYLFQDYSLEMTAIAALADIVIGNRFEFLRLAKFLKIENLPMKNILTCIKALDHSHYTPNCKEFSKNNPYKLQQMTEMEKIVICSDAEHPVHAVYGKSNYITFDVPYLEPSMVKDTTGAGDSFAAGFIVGFVMNKDINSCLELGCKTSQKVIQSIGCNIADDIEDICSRI